MILLSEVLAYIHPLAGEIICALPYRDSITEIRMSRGKKPLICTPYGIKVPDGVPEDESIFDYSVNALTGGNLYSVSDTLKQGYITLARGHRAGICASAVLGNKEVSNVRDISSICFRISREIKGCGRDIAREIVFDVSCCSCLIAAPPGYGKTTVLRDVARILSDGVSDGTIRRVGIADERGEIAAMHRGIPSFDIGRGAFVWDRYPKVQAITMMLRTMSPDFLVTDELGTKEDFDAVCTATRCGVGVVATVHAMDLADLRTRFGEKLKCFEKIFFISNKKAGYKVYGRNVGDY